MCCQVNGALDRRSVRLSATLCALNRRKCARAHVTTLKTNNAAGEAMAAKATWAMRADEACTRLCPLDLSALAGARSSLFALFHPFNRNLNAKTYNTIKH
jgi:hypothetical protein